jgi:hypothetical protein
MLGGSDLGIQWCSAAAGFWAALGFLLQIGLCYLGFRLGRIIAHVVSPKMRFTFDKPMPKWLCTMPMLKLVGTILVVSTLLAWMSYNGLGSHTEGGDYLYDRGEVVQDYEPSDAERLQHGVKVFVLACVLFAAGGITESFEPKVTDDE